MPEAPGDRPGVAAGVPAYVHPLLAPDDWDRLARPGAPLDWVVLNVADGPGTRVDRAYVETVAALRAAGVTVLGYLDTGYGTRPSEELISDAARHLSWYRVDGFFLDQVSSGPERLNRYRGSAGALRALGARELVLNPGVHPHPGYLQVADQVVTFEGPWSAYRWLQAPDWVADHPPERFCHLVYGVPHRYLDAALRMCQWHGAGTALVTDRAGTNPWEGLPGYWDAEERLLAAAPRPREHAI
ncbi:spherulation-specific family 4 protein [Allostreptomyces psammosilenae]|uniref:spherulation-specific family 4 protein n=1 Tax=Allostreptomyces psammosilenae TaxID=1892865 RepID=UPI0015C87201|nr:spherulation-specific family 4 protein [Allostreptomyces psammosilenae]